MASFAYTKAKEEIVNGTIDLLADTLKLILVTSSYVANPDHLVVDAGGANDPVDHEIAVTNYANGWGNSGRKTLSGKVISSDDTNDRALFDASDVGWTALGTGATIAAAILVKEGVANDTTSRLIFYFDITDTPTNGGDFNLQFSADGLLAW